MHTRSYGIRHCARRFCHVDQACVQNAPVVRAPSHHQLVCVGAACALAMVYKAPTRHPSHAPPLLRRREGLAQPLCRSSCPALNTTSHAQPARSLHPAYNMLHAQQQNSGNELSYSVLYNRSRPRVPPAATSTTTSRSTPRPLLLLLLVR